MKHVYLKILDRPLYLIILLLCLSTASIALINHIRQTKKESYFIRQQKEVQLAYQSSLKMYELGMKIFYTGTILNDEIAGLFAQGAQHDGYARALAKGRLYRRLNEEYQVMEQYNLHQLHFHLKNGTSYLRFHNPNQYGDNLTPERNSVIIANRDKQQVMGFEVGRVRAGFRHVFPVAYKGEHVGSVEMSVTTTGISSGMEKLDSSKEYIFLLNKKLIKKNIFKEQGWFYTPSRIHEDFVIEDALSLLKCSPKPVSREAQAINDSLKNDPRVQHAFAQGEELTVSTSLNGEFYLVNFLPIYDIGNQHAGFIASYKKDNQIELFLQESFIYIVFTTFFFLLIGVLLLGLNQRSRALAVERGQLQTISNTLPDGLIGVNSLGIIKHVNPAAERLLGYAESGLAGRRLQDAIIAGESSPDNIRAVSLLFDSIGKGLPFDGEIEIHLPDKRLVLEIGSRAITIDDQLRGAVIAFQDITARKEAEEALVKSEEEGRKLTAAVNSSTASIVITDLAARIEYVNPFFTEKTGYTAEEAQGQNPNILQSGNMSPDVYKNMWSTLVRGDSWKGELENKTKNGACYWEYVSISPIRNSTGEITHYIAVKEDITEKKKLENELRSQEFIQRTLMTNLPVGLLIVDETTRTIDHVNPAAAELIGTARENILGKPCHNFLCVSAVNNCPILDLGQKVDNSERVLSNIHGKEITVLKTVTKIKIRGVPKLLECFLDISKRIEAERQLRIAMDRVEKLAEQADAANRAKGMFLAHMSHEIRTPLNAILGYSQLLSKDPEIGEQQKQQVISISRCGDHLLDLINNVLETSKIEAGRIVINPEPMNFAYLLQDIETMFSQACKSKNLGLSFMNETKEHRQLLADKRKIRQIIMNLISNSMKFTEQGGSITLQSRIVEKNPEQFHITVDVIDTGRGIRPSEQKHLFTPFEQTSSGRSLQQGTGLGLSICKAFAKKMGGDITLVKSVPMKQTHFRFTFTAELAASPPAAEPHPPLLEKKYQAPFSAGKPAAARLQLSPESREALFSAVELGDMEGFDKILREETRLDAKEKSTLADLASRFDYDTLLQLLAPEDSTNDIA